MGAGATTVGSNALAIGAEAHAESLGASDGGSIAIGRSSSASGWNATSMGTNAQAKADGTVAIGAESLARGRGSVAVGGGTQVTADDSVALGGASVADRRNTVSVGNNDLLRQIVRVANGTEDNDAVNVSQLRASGLVHESGAALEALTYAAGTERSAIRLGGANGTLLTNLADGRVERNGTDAVNGGQFWILQDQVQKIDQRVVGLEDVGGVPPSTPEPSPTPMPGTNPSDGKPSRGLAVSGTGSAAAAPGSSASALGLGSVASGAESTSLGNSARAEGARSVALGSGSLAERDNTVSVGAKGSERTISNVAAGTERTDAANWGQVQDTAASSRTYTDGRADAIERRVGDLQKQVNRGIAASSALVNVTPYAPGKLVLNAGVASYRGNSALGVGVSRWNTSGRVNLNAGIAAAAGDSPIVRAGVGIVLGN